MVSFKEKPGNDYHKNLDTIRGGGYNRGISEGNSVNSYHLWAVGGYFRYTVSRQNYSLKKAPKNRVHSM